MGHSVSAEAQKLQVANFKAFESWLSSNRSKLVPVTNKAVIYAGLDPGALRNAKKLLSTDPQMTRMWQTIESINRDIKETTGQVKYDLLNDVLKRCGSSPKLLHVQGSKAGSAVNGLSNLLAYANTVSDEKAGYIEKAKIAEVWGQLSETYVTNSEGEVTLLEGRTTHNKRVTMAYVMVRKELEALWKRKDLPDATKKNAAQMIAGFMTHYDGQAQISEKIVKEAREVMKQARIARKGR